MDLLLLDTGIIFTASGQVHRFAGCIMLKQFDAADRAVIARALAIRADDLLGSLTLNQLCGVVSALEELAEPRPEGHPY